MANTKVPVELSSTPGIVDNSNATAITIDSSERVGIGTSSPSTSHKLTVSGDTKLTGQLSMSDSQLIKMGDGEDFAFYHDQSIGNIIKSNTSDMDILVQGNDGGSTITALTLDMSEGGSATFNKDIFLSDNSALRLGTGQDLALFHDGANSTIRNNTGDLILDVAGDIVLDADGGDINIRDGGTEFGAFINSSSDFKIRSAVSDKDLILQGNDGGSIIDAVIFDMSNGGEAIFYGGIDIAAGTDIELNDGTWTGEKDRKIQAHSGHIYYQSASHVFRNASGTNTAQVDGSGNFVALANITAYGSPSDIKLKENIEVIDNAVDKVKQLKGITYTLKSDGNRLTGLIAQDLEKVLPEAVYTSETIPDEINGIEAEEHLAIRYGNTVGLLVEAIKELEARVKELEGK